MQPVNELPIFPTRAPRPAVAPWHDTRMDQRVCDVRIRVPRIGRLGIRRGWEGAMGRVVFFHVGADQRAQVVLWWVPVWGKGKEGEEAHPRRASCRACSSRWTQAIERC